jgi:hypothetical protein
MIRKNLFIILLIASSIVILLSYLYFNNTNNNYQDSTEIRKNEIIKNIDNSKVVETISNEGTSVIDKICDNFNIKRKLEDLNEQTRIIKG